MKIFTYAEKNAILKHTIARDGLTAVDFVERVGEKVAREIKNRWDNSTRVVVYAGWDINGAEALEAAGHLLDDGYQVEIHLFNIGGKRLTPACQSCRKRLLKKHPDCLLHEIDQTFDPPVLNNTTLVIDGLFGADLDRPLPRSFGLLLRSINESGATVVSIDIPSGLFSEWNSNNSISRDIMHATLTLCVETPYLSFFMDDNAEIVGEWTLIGAGIDHEAVRKAPYSYYLFTRKDIHRILRPRRPEVSKADFGHAAIVAGSYGMMGAAALATEGALRAGAGKVTCYGPRCGCQILQVAAPSAMYKADRGENCIIDLSLDKPYTAIGIGPGIGTADDTIATLENFLKACRANNRQLVLDADALNCIAVRQRMLDYIPELSVLTPHAGEFDRLFGSQPSAEARLRKALEVSAYYNIVIVLKGRYTAVVRPDGKVHFNSSGTPALATGGTGDVLTGMITGLMAQGYTPETAAIVAVYLHGVAGELAEEDFGTYALTAQDLTRYIGKAIKKTME